METTTLNDVKEKIKVVLENNGITSGANDADIDVAAVDSIAFISFVVDIENTFEIVFPDELLTFAILQSLDGLADIVYGLLTENDDQ